MLPIRTEDGVFLARYSVEGLCELKFPQPGKSSPESTSPSDVPSEICQWHERTDQCVQKILAGKPPGKLPPLDLSSGTDFQRGIWKAMLEIPFGEVLSYAQLALKAGKPAAVRAVGGACGANPIPVLVPCHRVVAANRRIGGFSSGLKWKRLLLSREASLFRLQPA